MIYYQQNYKKISPGEYRKQTKGLSDVELFISKFSKELKLSSQFKGAPKGIGILALIKYRDTHTIEYTDDDYDFYMEVPGQTMVIQGSEKTINTFNNLFK